jgi:hypothetical protein
VIASACSGISVFVIAYGGCILNTDPVVLETIVGFTCNVVLFCYYFAPLSVIMSVVRNKDASK